MSETAPFLLLGAVIGSNNFAAALALGAAGQRYRRVRITTVFGLVEFVVPLVGIWVGQRVAGVLIEHASAVGGVLLLAVGGWTIVVGLRARDRSAEMAARVTSWGGLVALAFTLSADNLLVGFSLGLAGTEPLELAATIAAFSVTFTLLGLHLGSAARSRWGKRAEVLAGVLLALIGAATLLGAL